VTLISCSSAPSTPISVGVEWFTASPHRREEAEGAVVANGRSGLRERPPLGRRPLSSGAASLSSPCATARAP
jgi:hypothetical protein